MCIKLFGCNYKSNLNKDAYKVKREILAVDRKLERLFSKMQILIDQNWRESAINDHCHRIASYTKQRRFLENHLSLWLSPSEFEKFRQILFTEPKTK